ncbi:MAG: cbb3-type cytochrome c oxidase subunit I, partial [Bdellovibrionales bacterium]|nr:cbb3-type cytochrome c oxidase subunit I [Bdellovibrionales bacterium]
TMGLALFLPLIVNIACLFQTLRRNSVHSSPELLFGVSSLVMILAGALFGIPLLLGAEQSSKSYYMLGHFHYLFGPGAIFAFFAGVYSFGSQIFGKKLNETLSYLHFWPTLFGMNVVFLPMVILGVLGIAGEDILESGVSVAREVVFLQQISSSGVFFLLVSQLPFLLNCLFAICRPEFWARFDMLQERASAAIQPGSTY